MYQDSWESKLTANYEKTIDGLVDSLEPFRYQSPIKSILAFAVAVLALAGVIFSIYGRNPIYLEANLQQALSIASLLVLAVVTIGALFSALIPGRQLPKPAYLAIYLAIPAWLSIEMFFHPMGQYLSAQTSAHASFGFMCFAKLTAFTFTGALALGFWVKRQPFLQTNIAINLITLATLAASAAYMTMACGPAPADHLWLYHDLALPLASLPTAFALRFWLIGLRKRL